MERSRFKERFSNAKSKSQFHKSQIRTIHSFTYLSTFVKYLLQTSHCADSRIPKLVRHVPILKALAVGQTRLMRETGSYNPQWLSNSRGRRRCYRNTKRSTLAAVVKGGGRNQKTLWRKHLSSGQKEEQVLARWRVKSPGKENNTFQGLEAGQIHQTSRTKSDFSHMLWFNFFPSFPTVFSFSF